MEILLISLTKIVGSSIARTAVIINTDNGAERVAKSVRDNGFSQSSLAITADAVATVETSNYDFMIILQEGNVLTTLTGIVEDVDVDMTSSGLLDPTTLFKISNVKTINKVSSVVDTKDILTTNDNETVVRSLDITASALATDAFNVDSKEVMNINSKSSNPVSDDLSITSSVDRSIMATSGHLSNGKDKELALVMATSSLTIANTVLSPLFNKLDSLRGFDTDLSIGEIAMTYDELCSIAGGASNLPPIQTSLVDFDDRGDLNKDIALVSTRIIDALTMFIEISLTVDILKSTAMINGKVTYAPGLNHQAHSLKLLKPEDLVKNAIIELSILTYGVPSGYMVAAVEKRIGECSIDITVSSDFGVAKYKIRDNSSYYSSVITNSDATLPDATQLHNNTMNSLFSSYGV